MSKQKTKKILIAEDEKSYSRALIFKLENAGYQVNLAENGEEAVKILKKEKFDLLFLDLIMPKLNGFAVLEIIKKEKIKTKVVVLSNLSQEDDEKKVKQLGAIGFINKANTAISEIINQANKILK